MGQIGSYIRRKEDCPKQSDDGPTRHKVARTKRDNVLSSIGIYDLLRSRIPDAFLVHETKSYEFVDQDGDVAGEFFEEIIDHRGNQSHRILRRTTRNLTPQRAERYRIPRLSQECPIVMVQVQ